MSSFQGIQDYRMSKANYGWDVEDEAAGSTVAYDVPPVATGAGMFFRFVFKMRYFFQTFERNYSL